jgi:hypothetical protein
MYIDECYACRRRKNIDIDVKKLIDRLIKLFTNGRAYRVYRGITLED